MTQVSEAVAEAHRRGWASVLAATVRVAHDVGLAEECVQEAYAGALTAWRRDGVPANPVGWLRTAARRRAIDALRRDQVLRTKLSLLVRPEDEPAPEEIAGEVPDDRLGLIFMCCHPALARDVQPALTLRLVGGLTTRDIARAFLVPEPTMAARLTRAKRKMTAARIPFRVPAAADLPDRLSAVLAVIHLIYTAGHAAPSGPTLVRADLAVRALHLARMLRELMPDDREVRGLLALLLVTDARRATRVDDRGRLVRLADQDRSRWDHAAVAEAHELIVGALRDGRPGRYALQAAIAALYAQASAYDRTDWPQIVALYDELLTVWPSPVVALNRTVALAEVQGAHAALREVERLERDGRLAGYHYLPAVKAELLERLGRISEAAPAWREALELAGNEAEREFLTRRLAALT
ncbi:RNA polymerase sigma factor [Nucisporomicrobium flavum]|uniref:RNA polymerase sigma factor n=1 Tax=Nucisporomicrobium flavum TaxID=2785915 RepID=UPI003C2EEA2A